MSQNKATSQGNPPVGGPAFDDMGEDAYNFLAYMEGLGRKSVDPLSKEGMDLQAQYVASLPQHPLDILKRISVNVFCTPSERISAAKTLLEYSMRKVPSTVDVNTSTAALKIDASALSALTAEELDTLQALLAKTNGA
jgi:hypothetical protein